MGTAWSPELKMGVFKPGFKTQFTSLVHCELPEFQYFRCLKAAGLLPVSKANAHWLTRVLPEII